MFCINSLPVLADETAWLVNVKKTDTNSVKNIVDFYARQTNMPEVSSNSDYTFVVVSSQKGDFWVALYEKNADDVSLFIYSPTDKFSVQKDLKIRFKKNNLKFSNERSSSLLKMKKEDAQKIIKDFDTSDFIVCTDAGLSSTANRKFNSIQGRGFVTTQSIKKLKGFLQDFCLDDDGWYLSGSKKIYKLSELDDEADYDKVFYKDRWINEDGLEQHLIVTYSIKYRNYQRTIRDRQIERARKLVESPSKLSKKKANDPKRFIDQGHCTPDGEIASKTITALNQEQIENEAKYDGLYAVCTNLECDVSNIIKINQKRWEIEECFRIMKTEFKARPVYLSRKDRITAHFTTCFTALIIYRILEKKLNGKYTCEEIINTIRSMNMMIASGEGYIPTYTRTDLTDALHEAFGFRTDYQITSQKNMRKILNQTKKGQK